MSLNASQLDANGVPVLVPGERLFSQTRGVKMDYESGSGYPGEGHCYYANSGVLFLTSVRVVYVPVPPTPFLQNLTVPLELLS